MKFFICAFCAAAVAFGAGCTAELANRKLGPEETEWKEYLEPMYPGWKFPGTLPPAISDRYADNELPAMNNADNSLSGNVLSFNDNAADNVNAKDNSLGADASNQNIKVRYEDYTVEKGDSLSLIAKKVYGNGRKFYRIYKANEDIIKNQNRIYPGMILKIPRP
jgi:hypothetical protein